MHRVWDFNKKRYQILGFALIAAFFVACTLWILLMQMKKFSKESIYTTLEAVSEQRKHEIEAVFEFRKENLNVAAKFFENPNVRSSKEELIKNLSLCKEGTIFDYVFFADKNGTCINNYGEYYFIKDVPFFKASINGKPFIYTSHHLPANDGQSFSTITVPVHDENDDVIGVIGGTCIQELTNKLLFQNVVGNISSFLIDFEHNIIAHSEGIAETDEVFNFIKNYKADVEKQKRQQSVINEEQYFIVVDSMMQGDWVLVSMAEKSKISEKYFTVSLWGVLASTFNFLIFSILIMIMVLIYTTHLNQIKRHVFVDPVTQGISYNKFLEDAEKYVKYHKSGSILAVCLDINDFRIFNDLYGFEEGNNLLRLVYKMLKEHISSGLVCRVKSDTFYIITDFEATEAELITKREILTDDFNTLLQRNKKPYHVVFTVGFYRVEEFTTNVSSIFERANLVHNCAKKEGRLNIFYQERLRQDAIKQKVIENTMYDAFTNLEFQMYLQPKCELLSKRLVGAEALVRWESNSGAKRYPDEFIPVFEKTGFIVQLDLYMMECTCQLLRHWIDYGIEPVPISVNQSKHLLLNPIYFNVITTTIEKYNLPPELIEVEITETIMYDNTEALNKLIINLHSYGIRVAIDDFGSGYSSLILLRDIKADVLKIDKTFIYKAERDSKGKKILSSIIQLASTLNMKILAEGVETENQLLMLADLGCREVQGYLFGRPVPAKAFAGTFYRS